MSKAKDTIEDLRSKLFDRKKDEAVKKADEVIEATFDQTAYDVIQDPSTTARKFLGIKLKYDIKTKQAVVAEIRPFEDKTVGLSMQMDKENRKHLFEKNRSNK